jgi:hypothetical protein
MAQTSNKQSRETNGQARERITDRAFKILEQGNPKGWFWCSDRRDYYRYHDWMEGTGIGKNGR